MGALLAHKDNAKRVKEGGDKAKAELEKFAVASAGGGTVICCGAL